MHSNGYPEYVFNFPTHLLPTHPLLLSQTQVGKVDEIFGGIKDVHFSVKLSQGMVSSSFKADQKIYVAPEKLLPLQRFLPRPAAPKGVSKPGGRGGARGGARGGFGGMLAICMRGRV